MQTKKTDRKEISIDIRLAGEQFPTHGEMDLRWELQDEIEKRGIGVVGGGGAGGGHMDFSFQVDNIDEVNAAVEKVKQLLKEHGALERATITINDVYESFCEGETPNFQPGDCLSFRFEDSDYGALLVLARGYAGLSPGDELYTLVGVLDYKDPTPSHINIFEGRRWLLATHKRRQGKPYNVWLHCFDNAEIMKIGKVTLGEDEPYDCNFFLSWDIIAEYYLREKNRSR
jgi:hypothetical protein